MRIYYHSRFLDHRQRDRGHPEAPERLRAVMTRFQQDGLWRNVHQPAAIAREDLLLIHDKEYLDRMRHFGEGAWDADTYVRGNTWEIARLAAGAAAEAADYAWQEGEPTLALVRPPGHHATPNNAMGFCYLNNIALAAARHVRAGRGRVAIVDLDVHHGNGTQDAFYRRRDVLYISLHQYFFPGSGGPRELGEGEGMGFTVNLPIPAGQGDPTWLELYTQLVEPILRSYEPSMIFVSLGVDGHARDPLGQMQLSTTGYFSLMMHLDELARELCGHRIMWCLEGGYDGDALADVLGALVSAGRGSHLKIHFPRDDHPPPVHTRLIEALLDLHRVHWPLGVAREADAVRTLALMLMGLGALLLVLGAGLWIAHRFGVPVGRLPGDLHVEGKRWSIHFPIVTCIILSILLTLLLNFFLRR